MVETGKLKGIEFFKDLTDDELESVGAICEEVGFKGGEMVFKDGAPARGIYVLEDGKVSIEIEINGGKQVSVLTISGSGEPFGWSALVEPFKFTANARCVEDSIIISIDGKALLGLIEKNYRMGFFIMTRIAKMVSERVGFSRRQLLNCYYGG